MVMDNNGFILVTPVKDEEASLQAVIDSVVHQTVKPKLWVIVNDGSKDNSPKIIKEAINKHDWIKTIDLPMRERDIGLGYAFVCRNGFEYIVDYCKKNNIIYGFIGLLDADIILEHDYYEKLIRKFKKDERLGIAGGNVWSFNGETYIRAKERPDEPTGAARFWRKTCFKQSGGYLLTHSPDSVSNLKARLSGWETKVFYDLKPKQSRMESSAEGYWKGYSKRGEADYFLYKRYSYVLLRMLTLISQKKIKIGLAYITGYLKNFVNKKERISDEEIIRYNKKWTIKDMISLKMKYINKNK